MKSRSSAPITTTNVPTQTAVLVDADVADVLLAMQRVAGITPSDAIRRAIFRKPLATATPLSQSAAPVKRGRPRKTA